MYLVDTRRHLRYSHMINNYYHLLEIMGYHLSQYLKTILLKNAVI